MTSYFPAVTAGIVLTAAAVGFGAVSAHASDYTSEIVGQVRSELQAMDYAVQISGSRDSDLSRCAVSFVSGLTAGTLPGTDYLDAACPTSDN